MFEILGLFGNTLMADHMYSHYRSEKFPEQVQKLLSEKQKTFSQSALPFLQCT